MDYYSLIASLPVLEIGDEPPFSSEEYINNCTQWVSEREVKILRNIMLDEGDPKTCPHCKKWHEIETQIRNASIKIRAHKLGVDGKAYGKSGLRSERVLTLFGSCVG